MAASRAATAADFCSSLPFEPDAFQVQAIEALEAGGSALVAAPTGSGKTVVAEFCCYLALRTGTKCFYTTPLKALSNQKFGDLAARHGASNVGLLTGDNSINGEAPLVVMTTEVLRNMLYEDSPTLQGLRFVVLDEVHYLQDPYRGAVWEEVIIHLPEHIRVACLSATVSNTAEFGEWLGTLRGPTTVVLEHTRPVELRNHVLVGEELEPLFTGEDEPELNPFLKRAWAKAADMPPQAAGRRRHRPGERFFVPSRVEVADVLAHEGLLPAIYFIFSRTGCDKAVEACLHAGLSLTDEDEAERIGIVAEQRAATLADDDLRALGFATFIEALRRGVAAHHAGMLPVFKETVEELFTQGLVKLVFATETLSLGINMPAKSVVIERLTKFTGERHEVLTPMDYTQLTGRAGRRGIDTLGHAIVLFNPWVPLDRIGQLATNRSFPLTSSFRPSYNMAVNLVRNYDPETATHLLNASFAQFTADKRVVQDERLLARHEAEAAEAAEQMACELGDIEEYAAMREAAVRAQSTRRGSPEVRDAFVRLGPGDVLVATGMGRAVVVEAPRSAGAGPRATIVTADRKLRRVTPRDFVVPPVPLARLRLRGQSWRSAKVRRDLARTLRELDLPRPKKPPTPAAAPPYESHPCHECPDVLEHLKWAERHARAAADTDRTRDRMQRREHTIAATFQRVLDVLRRLDYVDGWSLTEKGRLLCGVYNEADLLVVECLERGWFAGLDPEELASIVSAFVYEARAREESSSAPTTYLSRYQRRIVDMYRRIHDVELQAGVELLKEPDPGFMAAMYEWARGASLEEVLQEHERSAGDFVRSAKQVVDLLQQLRQIATGDLAETLAESVSAVQRGVVAYTSV